MEKLIESAIAGFISLFVEMYSALLFYVLIQLLVAFEVISPSISSDVAAFGALVLMVGIAGYCTDFVNGAEFPLNATVYVVCGIIGFIMFSSTVYAAPDVGHDVITSNIISLVVISAGVALRVYAGQVGSRRYA